MKKLISILLICTLLFYYVIPPTYGGDVYAAEMDYYSILLQEVNNNGIYNEENGYDSYGVVYSKVADFDKNGTNEFYLVSLGDTGYKERLYSGTSIIYENDLTGPGGGWIYDNSLAIAEDDNGIYLTNYSSFSIGGDDVGLNQESHYASSYYKFSGNETMEIEAHSSEYDFDLIRMDEEILEGSKKGSEMALKIYENWDGVTPDLLFYEYSINGEIVSEDDYINATEYYNTLEWEQIILGDVGTNGVEVDSEIIITNLLDQLIESAKPTNLGDDIKGTLDEEFYTSLKKWLSYSEHFSDYTLGTELDDRTLFQYMFMPDGGAQVIETQYMEETNESEFPPNTYSRHKANEVDQFLSVYLGQAFSDRETIIDDEYFPFIKKDGYYYYPDFAMGWNSLVAPHLKGVYKLSDDIYYIDFAEYQLIELWHNDEYSGSGGESLDDVPDHLLMDHFSDEDRKNLYVENRGYAVMKVNVIDNEYKWTLIERNTQGATFDESVLAQFKKNRLAPATIKLNLEGISKVSDLAGFVEIIQEQIPNNGLNEQDKYLLTSYLSVALQKLNQQMIDSKKNRITITKDQFNSSVESMNSLKEQFDDSLQLEKLQLSKDLELINRVNVNYLNLEKPISVKMNDDLLAVLESDELQNQSLYISFDGSTRGILIDYSDLKTLLEHQKDITINLTYSDEGVSVEFLSENGEPLEKIEVPIQILMPASSKFSTVSLEEELWGGQYNDTNSSLVFETKQHGQFDIQTKDIEINDLSKLNPEQQEAVQFLVARGLFDTEDGNFNSSGTISRYDFAKTLVRLFFALDSEAVTSFIDIKEDSPYYKFVASGELNEIINGYEDGTFRGDTLIPVSHVLSFSGRTLANLKGYEYPAESEKYLQFMDANKILEESRGEIALAVREGLIEQGGMLEPQRQITRVEAAEILYKLYMLLYEEPNYMLSTTVEPPNSFIKENGIMIAGITITLVAILAGMYFWRRKKITPITTSNTLESQE